MRPRGWVVAPRQSKPEACILFLTMHKGMGKGEGEREGKKKKANCVDISGNCTIKNRADRQKFHGPVLISTQTSCIKQVKRLKILS